jgi:CDP-ribitol ribitolphosphotransferase
LKKYTLQVDNIYWERIQLFIEGSIDSEDEITNKNFILRNLTETKEVKANEVKIEGQRFIARFNVAILDDGNFFTIRTISIYL